ncbi:uncharacterized protein LOC133202968 [Saccostrea echinata]|uniref:uncharacterized protein LOC133202968 n=1 Tax=Saccostrea echinata TaxID=191078 RepID=UPI002A80E693|nr:uncharacterized protein LOC133202968 [Saccostrea echinata]
MDVTLINSFQYGYETINVLETFREDLCYIGEYDSEYTEKVNKNGAKEHKFRIAPTDMCVIVNGHVYFADARNYSISCLSPSGSVSTVISTDPLGLGGICQSMDGGLLVTLMDKESNPYKLVSHSRRLVKHITLTDDVIHEYEYQEDGQTRLFTMPGHLTQNSNSDICVVNETCGSCIGELVIMSSSDHLKSVYHGQDLTKNFAPSDVVCDFLCNILVTDPLNDQIHLLSSEGEFLKFLLTENEVYGPYSLSLYKSTLWKKKTKEREAQLEKELLELEQNRTDNNANEPSHAKRALKVKSYQKFKTFNRKKQIVNGEMENYEANFTI